MFIVLIQFPGIGMHKWTDFSSATYVIDANDKEDALKAIRTILPEKDPEVQKALCEQDKYKEDEYFEIRLHKVPPSKKIVPTETDSGFNKPYEILRI